MVSFLFIWDNTSACIRKEPMERPKGAGGLSLPNLHTYYWAVNFNAISLWLRIGCTKHQHPGHNKHQAAAGDSPLCRTDTHFFDASVFWYLISDYLTVEFMLVYIPPPRSVQPKIWSSYTSQAAPC